MPQQIIEAYEEELLRDKENNMSVFPKEVDEAADKMGGMWIKATEFEGEGLKLRCKGVEKVVANNPKYGATKEESLVRKEILAEGETFRYLFTDESGEDRQIDSKSMPMFIGFKQVDIEEGDWVNVVRTGKLDETRYVVTPIEPVEVKEKEKVDYPTNESEGINPEDSPF